jgi:hypothetical protein
MVLELYSKNNKYLAVIAVTLLVFGIAIFEINSLQSKQNEIENSVGNTDSKFFIVRENDPESIKRLFDRLDELGANRSSLRLISQDNSDAKNYARDDRNVYWTFINPRKIEGADADSFAIWDQNGIIARDRNHIYITGDMAPEANPDTFAAVSNKYRNGPYYHDDKYVFYTEVVDNRSDYRYRLKNIENADTHTFQSILFAMGDLASDDERVYLNGKQVDGIDGKTFSVTESSPYMQDKNGTYFFSLNSGNKSEFIFLNPSSDIQVFTNDTQSGGYVAIGDKMYFGTTTIYGADPKTFYVFDAELQQGEVTRTKCINADYCPYAKDASAVYFFGRKIAGADPNNFTPIGYGLLHNMGKDPGNAQPKYASDGRQIYFLDRIVEGADSRTFTPVLSGGYYYEYGKDEHYVYWRNKRIESADPATFKPVDGQQPYEGCGAGSYGVDKAGVYFQDKLISGADPKTFKAIIGDGSYGEDASRFYKENRPTDRSYFVECNYG